VLSPKPSVCMIILWWTHLKHNNWHRCFETWSWIMVVLWLVEFLPTNHTLYPQKIHSTKLNLYNSNFLLRGFFLLVWADWWEVGTRNVKKITIKSYARALLQIYSIYFTWIVFEYTYFDTIYNAFFWHN
jgi:hypothetical protein